MGGRGVPPLYSDVQFTEVNAIFLFHKEESGPSWGRGQMMSAAKDYPWSLGLTGTIGTPWVAMHSHKDNEEAGRCLGPCLTCLLCPDILGEY